MASKAGATFCLAMISIGSGLKTRASQRCRNNVFCRVKREMGPANLQVSRRDPPTVVRPRGGGGVERSHGLKLNYNIYLYYTRMTATS